VGRVPSAPHLDIETWETTNLASYTDSVMGAWNFSYDSLNRLAAAASGTNAPAPYANNYGCWSYDSFGNRLSQAISTTPCNATPPLTSGASRLPSTNTRGIASLWNPSARCGGFRAL
jgi:hypothetical protein